MTGRNVSNAATSAALSAVLCFAVSYTLKQAGMVPWLALVVGFVVGVGAVSLLAWWRFGRRVQ